MILDCELGAALSVIMFILQCLTPSHGVVYMAAKKHYFGVGGGTRRFLSVVEKDGELVLIIFIKLLRNYITLEVFVSYFFPTLFLGLMGLCEMR